MADEAGRAAYIAAFHAAQAYIIERTGAAPKTHSGVHSQFAKLDKDDPHFDIILRRFLSHAYELKTAADYDVDPHTTVPLERGEAAIATAARFIACAAKAVGGL